MLFNILKFILDRVMFPLLLVYSAIVWHSVNKNSPDWMFRFGGLLIPVVLIVLLVSAKKAKISNLSLAALVGIFMSNSVVVIPLDFSFLHDPLVLSVGKYFVIFYQVLLVITYFNLGRNIAVVPSLKSVVVSGSYRLVRHPIYSLVIHLVCTTVIMFPSIHNLTLLIIFFCGFLIRIREEEKIMSMDINYQNYKNKVTNLICHPLYTGPLLVLSIIFAVSLCTNSTSDNLSLFHQ